jgi:predicted transcriptional regulator
MPTTVRFIARSSNTDCCVQASLCIREGFRYMRSRELSAVAAVERGHVVGVISGRDIVDRVVLEEIDAYYAPSYPSQQPLRQRAGADSRDCRK